MATRNDDKVELLIGVYGSNEGRENTPNSPPGCLLPPPKPLVSDQAAGGALRTISILLRTCIEWDPYIDLLLWVRGSHDADTT